MKAIPKRKFVVFLLVLLLRFLPFYILNVSFLIVNCGRFSFSSFHQTKFLLYFWCELLIDWLCCVNFFFGLVFFLINLSIWQYFSHLWHSSYLERKMRISSFTKFDIRNYENLWWNIITAVKIFKFLSWFWFSLKVAYLFNTKMCM